MQNVIKSRATRLRAEFNIIQKNAMLETLKESPNESRIAAAFLRQTLVNKTPAAPSNYPRNLRLAPAPSARKKTTKAIAAVHSYPPPPDPSAEKQPE